MYKNICFFCGSNSGLDNTFTEQTRKLIRYIKNNNYNIVYGGGKIGLMGVVAEEGMKQGVEVTGIMPKFLIDKEIGNDEISRLIEVRNMSERIQEMLRISEGFVVLPGGFGTYEEFFEILSWSQMGLHKKPIGLLNINGFFNPLEKLLEGCINSGFAPKENMNLFILEDDPEKLMKKMQNFHHTMPNKYVN
ncbi:TIGR00730 family Rossman fold protein [Staphylococcus haemolyticus]|uniref:Cytokinin riboside 5'-monophosphate phosphoribohydrolase n=1 Tax=Staphylococcus simulans TaxID=1286 RepID=A0A6N2Z4Z2_STASI|nr:TIGR00730 family Rossman fold protein [Staphylococcus haemolyticus]HDD4216964.1 TIGR00730 family Rossman fold protein [Staphylococcus aureus]